MGDTAAVELTSTRTDDRFRPIGTTAAKTP
jgi:hypothetical protein